MAFSIHQKGASTEMAVPDSGREIAIEPNKAEKHVLHVPKLCVLNASIGLSGVCSRSVPAPIIVG